MALQTNITLDNGINCIASYARISGIALSHTELFVNVQVWANEQARTDEKPLLKSLSLSLPWQDTISLAGAYTLLKTQADFTNALDV
jgi:hypothetical protein